jgi:hypothetical protein
MTTSVCLLRLHGSINDRAARTQAEERLEMRRYHPSLEDAILPQVASIAAALRETARY